MRLTRNTTEDGRCKYALVRLDKITKRPQTSIGTPDIQNALAVLEMHGVLEYAGKGDKEEAFTIKLKDKFAAVALHAYADACASDPEYSREVRELAERSENRKDLKRPD